MIQFVSTRPGTPAAITHCEVTHYDTSNQYCIKLTGDVSDVFPDRVEVIIDGDWLMIRGNYKEGYHIKDNCIRITAIDDAHKQAIDRFCNAAFNGMGYNKEVGMFGFNLKYNINKPITDDEVEEQIPTVDLINELWRRMGAQ